MNLVGSSKAQKENPSSPKLPPLPSKSFGSNHPSTPHLLCDFWQVTWPFWTSFLSHIMEKMRSPCLVLWGVNDSANGHSLLSPPSRLPPSYQKRILFWLTLMLKCLERRPYPFPEVLSIMPCVGGATGVLTAGARKRQLTAAAAVSRTEMTRDDNPQTRAFQSRDSWFCIQLAFLKKQESSERGLCFGDSRSQVSIIGKVAQWWEAQLLGQTD